MEPMFDTFFRKPQPMVVRTASRQPVGFVIRLPRVGGRDPASHRQFVKDSRDVTDWLTLHADEAKVWKTRTGANRWISARGGITGAEVVAVGDL